MGILQIFFPEDSPIFGILQSISGTFGKKEEEEKGAETPKADNNAGQQSQAPAVPDAPQNLLTQQPSPQPQPSVTTPLPTTINYKLDDATKAQVQEMIGKGDLQFVPNEVLRNRGLDVQHLDNGTMVAPKSTAEVTSVPLAAGGLGQ